MRGPAKDTLENPFPGLRPFQEGEEHLFFGRENQVDTMVDKLAATHFLTVVGTSGSGKSSLVNCGLRPALLRGLLADAGTSWRMAYFRPGNEPISAMARALAEDRVLFSGHDDEALPLPQLVEATLRMSKLGLIDIVQQAALGDDVNFLLVVDQFEELFRFRQLAIMGKDEGRAAEEATAFVNLLLEVRERAPKRIFVVLTMRSDFIGDCTQFPGLAEAINAGQYLVPRLTRDERRDAIEGPIQMRGVELSPVLLTQLVNDVGDNPDQLSILQHALNRTWAYWRKQGGQGPIELSHYAAIGTMAKALNQHADEALHELADERQKQICEKMFKALTDRARDPRGVRRPTKVATLCALTDASIEELTHVVDVFREKSRSFLMPPIKEKLRDETIVDISHESLMRVWDQLNVWAGEEAQSVRVYRRLAEAAQEYERGETSLYTDPQLQVALDWRNQNKPNETWAERYHPGFAGAIAFLERSEEERDVEAAEEQQRKQRELDAAFEKAEIQSRNAKRMLWAAIFCGLLAVVSLAFFLQARQATLTAEASKTDAQIAQTRALVNAAARSDPAAKILLALEALPDDQERVDWPVVFAAEDALAEGIDNLRERAVLTGHVSGVTSVAITANGDRIVTGSDDSTARVWDGATGALLFPLGGDQGVVLAVAMTPDGRRIVTGSNDNSARVWDGNTGAPLFKLDGHRGAVLAVGITPDGSRIVTGSNDKSARIWDGNSGAPLFVLERHKAPVSAIAITPDGARIVTGSNDKFARVWDANTGSELRELEHASRVTDVAIGTDGRRVATASQDRSVTVWDDDKKTRTYPLKGEHDAVLAIAVTRGGVELFTGLDNYAARLSDNFTVRKSTANPGSSDPNLREVRVEFSGHAGAVRAVAATADGLRIVTGSDDSTARVWNAGDIAPLKLSFKTRDDLRTAIANAKALVPRCLTISERMANLVSPQPPAWCIETDKFPYHTQLWKNLRDDQPLTADSEISRKYGDFADAALKGNSLRVAEAAAKLGLKLDPSQTWITINLASAHMFMGQIDLAKREYLSYRGQMVDNGTRPWDQTIFDEFDVFRRKGRKDALMDEIERELGRPKKSPE